MHPEHPSDPPRQFVDTRVGRLAYTDEGEGDRTIVALHGLPGSARDFRWLAPALEGFRVLRVDLPGYGESRREAIRAMTIEERTDAIAALLDVLEPGPAHLVSHSAGGFVALHLARHHPEHVASLALLACPGPTAHYPVGLYRALAAGLRHRPSRFALRYLQRVAYRAVGFPSSLTDRERTLCTLDAAAQDFDLHRRNMLAIDLPTLLAFARDDRMIPTEKSEALADALPEGPRLRFEAGGHNIQKTRAIEIAAALDEFA